MIPGLMIGYSMSRKARHSFAPRSIAASTVSLLTTDMLVRMTRKAKGSAQRTWPTSSVHKLR